MLIKVSEIFHVFEMFVKISYFIDIFPKFPKNLSSNYKVFNIPSLINAFNVLLKKLKEYSNLRQT